MSIKRQPIGVFDSGVGGLTALTKLAELLPYEDLLYLGDTARVPYGNRSTQTIQYYANQCVDFLHKHGVKLILVACNTISSVALLEIEKNSAVPVIGVIKPAVAAALNNTLKHEKIGIIGTRATIQSQSYAQEIYHLSGDEKIVVCAQACPLFVPLIEEGWHEHSATYAIAQEYLLPLQEAQIDTLILACTHYPLLKKMIRDIMPGVRLIDSGEEAAVQVAQTIQAKMQATGQDLLKTARSIECYMTDMTTTSLHFAQQLLGVSSEAVHQISIEKEV